MMTNNKLNLFLFQFSFQYGNNVYLPFSVGMLWTCTQ